MTNHFRCKECAAQYHTEQPLVMKCPTCGSTRTEQIAEPARTLDGGRLVLPTDLYVDVVKVVLPKGWKAGEALERKIEQVACDAIRSTKGVVALDRNTYRIDVMEFRENGAHELLGYRVLAEGKMGRPT